MPIGFSEYFVTINGSGGAVVTISLTRPCRMFDVVEQPDPATYVGAFVPQGLVYETPAKNTAGVWSFAGAFTPNGTLQPGEPYDENNRIAIGNAVGPVLGMGAQTTPDGKTIPARPMLKVRSATATATKVRVRETY